MLKRIYNNSRIVLLILGLYLCCVSCQTQNKGKKPVKVKCIMPERITHENVIGVVVMVNRDNNEHGVFVLSKTNTYKMRMDVDRKSVV